MQIATEISTPALSYFGIPQAPRYPPDLKQVQFLAKKIKNFPL
jgi:hypothetical protein